MLKELYIENLAIIEKAVITFDKSFNVFSGETGAGKSILIGGINAVLGGRVSKDIVRAGAEKARVTALFTQLSKHTLDKLTEYGYESEEENAGELILTREISESGTSTARINGKTATAAILKEVAGGLLDVHGQHQTRLITSRETQLEIIDNYGNIELSEYQNTFREFSRVSKQLKKFQQQEQYKNEKIEILTAKIVDIEPYKLRQGEEDEIARKLEQLRNIQNITETLNRAYTALNGDGEQFGAVELLNLCKTSLSEAAKYVGECEVLSERLNSLFIELDDVKHEIAPLVFGSDGDDINKLHEYEERMSDFLRLRRKYGLSIDELVEQLQKWREELELLQSGEDYVLKLTAQKKQLGDKVRLLGEELSRKRKQTAEQLSALICNELEFLDMPGTRLEFVFSADKVTITGMDSVEFLIAVNKGEALKPLAKIASGGELSRIMLGLKVVFAKCDDVPSMVFDEVDSGISGRAAHKVGLKLTELSKERQVLCVTHLAQIAAMADNHLLIEKTTVNVPDSGEERTFTDVKKLTGDDRKRELARIISGDDDEISIANAERLLLRNPSPVMYES